MPIEPFLNRGNPLVLPRGRGRRDEDQLPQIAAGPIDPSAWKCHTEQGQDDLDGYEIKPRLLGFVHERASTLQQLHDHPSLIPDWMKDGRVYFAWGDVLRDDGGNLYVLYFYWNTDHPIVAWCCLDSKWGDDGVALHAG